MIMQKRRVNRLGLHARAAARLVDLAAHFDSKITIVREDSGRQVNAKSIFGVLMLAASQGTELEIVASGGDETAALEAICKLIESRFGEE